MNTWSLQLNPEAGQESEAWLAQKSRWPGACHDGVNTLFSDTSELETDAILIERNEDETDDQLAWRLAQILVQPNRPPLHMNGSTWDLLYRHPAYRLYVGQYEDAEDQFKSDLQYMLGMIEVGMPEAAEGWSNATKDATPDAIRGIITQFISMFRI